MIWGKERTELMSTTGVMFTIRAKQVRKRKSEQANKKKANTKDTSTQITKNTQSMEVLESKGVRADTVVGMADMVVEIIMPTCFRILRTGS